MRTLVTLHWQISDREGIIQWWVDDHLDVKKEVKEHADAVKAKFGEQPVCWFTFAFANPEGGFCFPHDLIKTIEADMLEQPYV